MAKNYELGRDYYLPVTVHKDGSEDDVKFPIGIKYNDGNKEMTDYIMDKPDLLLTAGEIATDINTERAEIMETLGKQNLELSKQNEELSARVEELTDLTNYYIAERQRNNLNIRLLLDKIAELEGKNG